MGNLKLVIVIRFIVLSTFEEAPEHTQVHDKDFPLTFPSPHTISFDFSHFFLHCVVFLRQRRRFVTVRWQHVACHRRAAETIWSSYMAYTCLLRRRPICWVCPFGRGTAQRRGCLCLSTWCLVCRLSSANLVAAVQGLDLVLSGVKNGAIRDR